MEPEKELNEAEYIKGFNQAYTIAKYEPKLAEKLKGNIELNSDRASGLYHGLNQYFKEKEEARTKDLGAIRSKSKDKDKER